MQLIGESELCVLDQFTRSIFSFSYKISIPLVSSGGRFEFLLHEAAIDEESGYVVERDERFSEALPFATPRQSIRSSRVLTGSICIVCHWH